MSLSTEVRFLALVAFEPNCGCWLWLGAQDRKGYGLFKMTGGKERAHRASYRLFKGRLNPKMTLDHTCRMTSCVNPDHLVPVTNKENVRRMHRHRRKENASA